MPECIPKIVTVIETALKCYISDRLISLKKEPARIFNSYINYMVFFITSLRGNDNLLIKMKTLKVQRQFFDEDLVEDVEIELRQAQDSARIYSDILSGTMDAYASVISNNLNIVMKRMTSISIILMLPTLIASLYGMNVPNSLEENPYGFLIVIIISILFSVFGFIVFKWRHWF